jgi:hypothetical protein
MRVGRLAQHGAPFGESGAERVAGDRKSDRGGGIFEMKLKLAGSLLSGRFERPTN